MHKYICLFSIKFCCSALFVLFLRSTIPAAIFAEPAEIPVFRQAYPDLSFQTVYDTVLQDWKIDITTVYNGRHFILYWDDGRMIPPEARKQEKTYWPLLYRYADTIPDPAAFTPAQIEQIRKFSSTENRRNGASTPLFFFDSVYDAASRTETERHLSQVTFLGKQISVHEKITGPLHRVQNKIYNLAASDPEVQLFITSISQADGYYWRDIRDRTTRSFHSYGLAIDLLPDGWKSKILYWGWQKQRDPVNWMLTPLSKRWMPPESVIQIFESEGFIWGGKWGIWDNMHFEYRPELILYRNIPYR